LRFLLFGVLPILAHFLPKALAKPAFAALLLRESTTM